MLDFLTGPELNDYYFSAHDSVCISCLETLFNISIVVDASICHNGNVQGMLDFLDKFPVACPDCLLILLFCSAVDSQETTTCLLHSFSQFNSLLVVLQHSHFAEQRHFQSLRHCLDDPYNEIRF